MAEGEIAEKVENTTTEERVSNLELVVVENQKQIGDVVKKLDSLDSKMDLIIANTGTLNRMDKTDGTIQQGNWRGSIAEIVSAIFTFLSTAWGLWAVMLGYNNPYWAALSVMSIPIIYILIKGLTGKNIKDINLIHTVQEQMVNANHEREISTLQEVLKDKDMELWMKRERIKRLEEGIVYKNEIKTPILPET